MRTNRMKEMLGQGRPALGCSLMFPSPPLVEMLAHAGFDWVLLDCEHGSLSLADLEVMAMAADAAGITAIARPHSNAAADIQSVLDRGVAGVQIPHINTAEDARRAVEAVKFGPGAARGLAAGTRPDRWGMGGRMADFAAQANAHRTASAYRPFDRSEHSKLGDLRSAVTRHDLVTEPRQASCDGVLERLEVRQRPRRAWGGAHSNRSLSEPCRLGPHETRHRNRRDDRLCAAGQQQRGGKRSEEVANHGR